LAGRVDALYHGQSYALSGIFALTVTPSETLVDLRGLKCPLPALKTRKVLGRTDAGAVLRVECTDPLSAIDIPNLVRETGDELLDNSREGDILVFRIRKRA
jgi:tRNA 2-thiouridine synthesizing protein A